MNIHEKYINRCIELAKNGIGATYPNPLVGSVIVLHDSIIGEGWHQKAGEPHAEVNAIQSVVDKSQLKNATIYVSLEPCSHYGKTPPCSNLIVSSGIKHVVIGTIDTNSKVSGKGIAYLKSKGCRVEVGVKETECKFLNKRFFTFHEKKRPYVILKWAETLDGFIDKLRDKQAENMPNWISNQYSQQLVHKMRTEEQAILIGTTTALNDNPKLTARKWYGKNPTRVVLDRNLRIPITSHLYDGTVKTIVLTAQKPTLKTLQNVYFENIDFSKNVPLQICDVLYQYNLQSVIVEGGKKLLQSFIDENIWDEAFVFVGKTKFVEGLASPNIKKAPSKTEKISDDTLNIYYNK
ncbi:bifunctional diaminohydroxyphosphoribosylaminopyrimidine deaminase/5-amino-6-(5-phosphoribosylamino)uracil reductase RibD [Lutibacter sp.]